MGFDKKRILLVGKLPPPYMGPAIATDILLNSSLKEDFELLHFNNTINTTIETQGKWGLKKIFRIIRLNFRFYLMLKQKHPDLILYPISQSSMGFLKDAPFLWLSWKSRAFLVVQLRGSNLQNWLQGAGRLINFLFAEVMKHAAGAIVLGEKLRYLFEPYLPLDRIYSIPNGGNYTFPNLPKEEGVINILYFANLYESKGVGDVVDACAFINEDITCKLRLVGGWRGMDGFRKKLEEKVKSATVKIEIHPPVSGEPKWTFFAQADIFVFPPREPEGHPWVIVEALAAGLPIITTDQGAITESVMDGWNGFVVPSRSPRSIAEKINQLSYDIELQKKMGSRSRVKYETFFTEEKMAQKYKSVFNQIIS